MLILNRLSGFGSAGGSAGLKVEFHSSAASTSTTIGVPASVEAGDLFVCMNHAYGFTGAPTSVVPSGFTTIINNTAGIDPAHRFILSRKIAIGSEAGSNLSVMSGDLQRAVLLVFRKTPPISAASHASEGRTGPANPKPADRIITSADGSAPLIAIAFFTASGTQGAFTRSLSPAQDGEILATTSNYPCVIQYKIFDSGPSNVTAAMSDGGSANTIISCYIEVS